MRFLLTLLFCYLPVTLWAQQADSTVVALPKSGWQDARLLSWNRLILDGKKTEALDAIEQDLGEESPHFASAWYWYELTVILDNTDKRFKALEGAIADRLKVPVEIFQAYDDEQKFSITEKYPDGSHVDDVMALVHLQWSSEKSESELAYLQKALEQQPESVRRGLELGWARTV